MSIEYDENTLKPEGLLEILYTHCDEEDRRDALQVLADMTWHWQRTGEAHLLNETLEKADVQKLSRLHASALLRYTCARRDKWPAWQDYRTRCIERFQHDADFKSVFTGLLPEHDKYYEQKSPWENAFDKLVGIHPTLQRD